jgi:CRP-like cAMP-binding protein
MTEAFTRYISRKGILNDNESAQLLNISFVRTIPKGGFLLREGRLWKQHAFLLAGYLRTYQVNEQGLEKTTGFTKPGSWTGDGESLRSRKPSNFNIEALTQSTLLLINSPEFEGLAKAVPALNQLLAFVVDRNFIAAQARIYMAVNYSAGQRYAAFLADFGPESRLFPKNAIASYLNITPETLSRIKKPAKPI